MATSGSFVTANVEGRCLKFSWSVKSQSTATNSTVIEWSLDGYGGDTGTWYACSDVVLTIDGATVYTGSTSRFKLWSDTNVANGTYTFTHSNDGKRSFSAEIEASLYYFTINATGSGSFDLPTIARKSTLSASNGTLGTAQTLTVTMQSNTFSHTIKYTCGTASGTICTKSSDTSISFTPPLSLASQNTTGTTVAVKLTITTYDADGNNIGSGTVSISCAIPSNVKPYVTFSVSDAQGLEDKYGFFVRNLSRIKVVVDATPAYDSPITACKVVIGDSVFTGTTVASDVYFPAGDLGVAVTVTDARNRSNTAETVRARTVVDYSAPQITALAVCRCDSDGTENELGNYVKVTFSANVTSLSAQNTATYVLKYKKTTATSYTSKTISAAQDVYAVTNQTYIFSAATDCSYDVVLTVTDNHATVQASTSASTAFAIMHWNADGTAMAVGKLSEESNLFDVGIQMRARKGIITDSGTTIGYDFGEGDTTGAGVSFRASTANMWASGSGGAINFISDALNINGKDINDLFAPAGYGLGEYCYGKTGIDITDSAALDNLTYNCFWCYRNSSVPLSAVDGYTKYVQGITIAYSGVNAVQIGYCLDTGTRIERSRYNGTWRAWRFENPPMVAGNEYPTTERRNGAVVYRKRISYTNTAAFGTAGTVTNVSIPHGIDSFGTLVRCAAKGASYPLPHIGSTGHMTGVINVDATNITLRTLNAWAANVTWDFDLAYTKS